MSTEKKGFEGISRSSRETASREKQGRRKPWTPPSMLDAPPAPEGFKHRWIRAEVRGFDDTKNISARLREGYELVRQDEYPDFESPVIDSGKYEGVFGVGGLMLIAFSQPCRNIFGVVKTPYFGAYPTMFKALWCGRCV